MAIPEQHRNPTEKEKHALTSAAVSLAPAASLALDRGLGGRPLLSGSQERRPGAQGSITKFFPL